MLTNAHLVWTTVMPLPRVQILPEVIHAHAQPDTPIPEVAKQAIVLVGIPMI